jgi:Flp pilus assembly protein CpaB
MITLVDVYPGEVILEQRLLDPNVESPNARLALVMAEDEVLMAFPAGDLINQLNVLKSGDHVDFHFTYALPIDRETGMLPFQQPTTPGEGETAESEPSETVTFSLLQNITLASVLRARDEEGQETGEPQGLLLAVSPQEALVLKYMKDIGATVDLVLRSPGAEGEFPVETVDLDYIINGYILPGETQP